MNEQLCIQVRWLDARYHGTRDRHHTEWPPSPARLFQALVSAAARGDAIDPASVAALQWLERQSPPTLYAAPTAKLHAVNEYVPNNELDGAGLSLLKVGETRDRKSRRGQALSVPTVIYQWPVDEVPAEYLPAFRAIVSRLYQLGRGVDMATAMLIDPDVEAWEATGLQAWRPLAGAGGQSMPVPRKGSLAQLQERYQRQRNRIKPVIETVVKGKKTIETYSERLSPPPPVRFARQTYNPSHEYAIFEIRRDDGDGPERRAWPLSGAVGLVTSVRDALAARLCNGLPDNHWEIERFVIGRGATAEDLPRRLQLLPLPSIGHEHADHQIRRIALQVPGNCPLEHADLVWGADGLDFAGNWKLGLEEAHAAPRQAGSFLRHFVSRPRPGGLIKLSSLTPVALGVGGGSDTTGTERATQERQAQKAARRAMRQAGLNPHDTTVSVRRAPFTGRGIPAGKFAASRFSAHELWHVSITCREPPQTLLAIGNGRFLGLGILAPDRLEVPSLIALRITDGLLPGADETDLCAALRRAVLACVQQSIGPDQRLPGYFSGHEENGKPLANGDHAHIAIAADLTANILLVIPPHTLQHRLPNAEEIRHAHRLEQVVHVLQHVNAGKAGKLLLGPLQNESTERYCQPSMNWRSQVRYHANRYFKRRTASDALQQDALLSLQMANLPSAEIKVLEHGTDDTGRLWGHLELHFGQPVNGPILLGRTRHKGGGFFMPTT